MQYIESKLINFAVKGWHTSAIALYRKAIYIYLLFFTLLQLPTAAELWSDNALLPIKFFDGNIFLQSLNLLSHQNFAPYYWIIVGALMLCCVLSFFLKRQQVLAVLIYFLYSNLYFRSITIQNGSADLMHIQLFFLMFMNENTPSLQDGKWKQFQCTLSNFAFLASQLQVILVYLIAGFSKVGAPNWVEGNALHFVALNEEYSVEFFKAIAWRFPLLLKGLSWAILLFQLSFPVLIWIKRFKSYLLGLGVLLHLSITLLMGIPDFGLIMIVMYLLFCSESWCNAMATKLNSVKN